MAKQVEDIVVRLVGEGFEALDKIKGSFRELGKVTNLAEKDILSARDSLLDYARKAGNTEAVNKGLGDAFKGLRSQVDMCSDAYRVLSADLRQIDEVSRGATQSVMAQRNAVLASTTAGTQNVAALQRQLAALVSLRAQTREASTAFDQFSQDIRQVETRLDNLADVNRRFNATLVQSTAATAAGARVQLEALTAGIALRRQEIADIDTRSAGERRLRTTIEERLGLEERLNTALSIRRRIQFQEGARTGREAARTGAATFNDPTVTAGFLAPDRIAQRLGDLPNTTAGLSQELGELNERLINTYRSTDAYLQVAMQMAGVQRELTSVTRGYAQSLVMGLKTNTVESSARNLQEAITALRAEMAQLDTTTSEGSRAYADNAREANTLDRRLRNLADAYREVGSMATVAATAEQNAANARIRNNYLGRGAVLQQEQALRELGNRVQQGVAATPLLLPAAGQTSAPGTGGLISGGARRLRGQVETTFGAGVDAAGNTPRAPWQQNYLPNAAVGTAPAVGFAGGAGQRDALMAASEAARATEQQMQRLRAAVDTATKANTGSVSSLGRLREALVNLRNEIPGTEKEFRDLNQQVEGVDRRSSRLQVSRRPSTGQLVQAGGAAISGGIFGGPEGFLGGVGGAVLGTALPGIGTAGGAFAGAAAGAQVGMFRQQLAGTADYAASIGKLQIALRGVVGSQAAYDEAIRSAAAATRDLNIPQEEATRGLTRLSAAVIGAGGTVADSSFAFRAMSEAIKATGGNAEQVDGALLALTQVFSKGKVSAEELNQIAERLPGTFTLFAQAAGKTGPELQKALEQGEVGLNDLMKFLELTGDRYGKLALDIAGSSQDAGARLTVAFQAMRLEVGKALQPLGAELQGAFATFISDITPAIVGSAKAIAAALSFLTTNDLVAFGVQLTAVSLGFKGLQVAAAALTSLNIASWFTATAVGAKVTSSGMAAATVTTGGLTGALKALTLAMAKNPITLLILAGTAAAIKIGSVVLEQKKLNDEVQRSLDIAAKAPASGVATEINATENALREARSKLAGGLQGSDFLGFGLIAAEADVARLETKLQKLKTTFKGRVEIETIFKGLGTVPTGYKVVNGRLAYLSPGQGYVDAETGKPVGAGRTKFPGGGGEDGGEKAGAALLQAIEQREEALLNLRNQREEQLAQIREQAVEQAKQIETQLADRRLAIERQIQDITRQRSDSAEDSQRRIRGYLGEDSGIIEAEQEIVDIFRKERDAKLDSERRLADDKQEQERTIAEFQRGVAKSINDANRAHTKSMGEIQKQYATSVAKIIDEGTGKAGKRLAAAAQLAALYIQRGVLNNQIGGATGLVIPERASGKYDFAKVGSAGVGSAQDIRNAPRFQDVKVPLDTLLKLDETIESLRKGLSTLRAPAPGALLSSRSTGIGDQFTALLGAEGGYEDVAMTRGLLAQNSGAPRATPESQILRDAQGRPLNGSQPTAYPIPVIPSAAQTTQLRNDQAQAEQDKARGEAADELQEAFKRVNAESTEFTKGLNDQLKLLGSQRKYLDMGFSDSLSRDLANLDAQLSDSLNKLTAKRDKALELGNDPATVTGFYNEQKASLEAIFALNVKLTQELEKQGQIMRTRQDDRIGLGMQEGVQSYLESIGTMRQATEELTVNGIKGVENAIFDLVTTGKTNFREFAADILRQTARMIIQQLVLRNVLLIVKSAFGFADGGAFGGGAADPLAAGGAFWNAKGNAFTGKGVAAYAMGGGFAANNIIPYAKGGTFTNSIVSKPTLFKFAAGGTMQTGVMGEAGPEAIMPLSRGPNGKLGVASSGSGTTNVTVNVDASGSKAQGDSGKSEQLGRAVSQAVQDELLRQRRPGGLLA